MQFHPFPFVPASYRNSQVWLVGVYSLGVSIRNKRGRVITVAAGDGQPVRSEEMNMLNVYSFLLYLDTEQR